jgi:hypothetical protein
MCAATVRSMPRRSGGCCFVVRPASLPRVRAGSAGSRVSGMCRHGRTGCRDNELACRQRGPSLITPAAETCQHYRGTLDERPGSAADESRRMISAEG